MLVLTWHDIVARWFTISKVRAQDGAELGSKVAAARPGQRNTDHHRHTSALVFCHGMPRILSGRLLWGRCCERGCQCTRCGRHFWPQPHTWQKTVDADTISTDGLRSGLA